MKGILIVFSVIALVIVCMVFDQYTAEERKAILAKVGFDVSAINTDTSKEISQAKPAPIPAPTEKIQQGTVYYCVKDGQKIISDRPCISLDAREQEQKQAADYQPLSTTDSTLNRDKQTLRQMESDRLARENKTLAKSPAMHNNNKENKERHCNELYREKDNIKAQQRQHNSAYWNQRHRQVDDKIFELKCGFR